MTTSEVIQVLPNPGGRGFWLIFDCQHWYHWGAAPADDHSGATPPKEGAEYPCPKCRGVMTVVALPAPSAGGANETHVHSMFLKDGRCMDCGEVVTSPPGATPETKEK